MKKIQLFCIAENTPETHYNLEVMFGLLNLEQIDGIYSLDLKLANLLVGISVSEMRFWDDCHFPW